MKIAAGLPSPKDLIKNEIDSLQAIGNNPSLCANQQQLATDAHRRHQFYKNQKTRVAKFGFSSWMEFPASPIAKKAFVECLIRIDTQENYRYDILTYSFGLLKRGKQNHLIKKFHIDFTYFQNTGRPPLHPIFHMQSPGTLSPMLTAQGIKDDHLEPSLSEPRLYYSPTTLVLIIDFLLREFGGDHTSQLSKLTRTSEWRGLIRKNEDLILQPYYKACSGFFTDRKSKKEPERHQLFSQDFAYGLS